MVGLAYNKDIVKVSQSQCNCLWLGGGPMRNISDIIEQYLKKRLHTKGENVIEIKRSEVADQFQCVPSQINYVINTRFTIEKGYIVESKRGGGGYIRIIRVIHQDKSEMIDEIIQMIQPAVTQRASVDILERLLEEEIITEREAAIIASVMQRETLAFPLPMRDEVRTRLLTAMLTTLKYE